MEWIKQRVKNSFKYSTISGIIAVVISASLVTIDPSKSPKKVIAVFEQPQQEIFEYVTNSDEFHEVNIDILNEVFHIITNIFTRTKNLHIYTIRPIILFLVVCPR